MSIAGEPDDEVREKLSAALALLFAGNRTVDCWAAITDYFSAMIGFSSDSPEHAQKIVDDVAKDFKANIEKHWYFYRKQRSTYVPTPTQGDGG